MPIGSFIRQKLFDRFLDVYEDIMRDCKYSPKLADLAIRFEEPIYGTNDFSYAHYLAPTNIIGVSFFLAATVSTSLIITEQLEGVWDRSVVQGVTTAEIILSHVVIQSVIIIIHTVMIMLLIFAIWGLECKGPIFVVMVLTFLTGSCGLMYGFVISVTCKNHTAAHYTTFGTFLTIMLLN
ncbi:PREDICTED: uncharacterized protein LOC108771207, partial [Cyphomyrmex costatus]